MAEVAQPRRSRRFSFSRRPQSIAVTEEPKSHPPVTTIGFPIDAIPLNQDNQQERPTSSWRNAFRRSQSVDRTNSRAPSSDRRASRRLVKKQQPGRDTSVSSQAPTLPNVPLLSNISTRIQSRRASVSNSDRPEAVEVPHTDLPSQYGYDRISSNTRHGQREQQKNDQPSEKDLPQAPATPTLRRVGSPFYLTASDKAAATSYDAVASMEQRPSLDTTQDDSMIPHSLRVGRSKMESQDRATSPIQGNPSYHSLPRYSPSDAPAQQVNYDSISSLVKGLNVSKEAVSEQRLSVDVDKRNERIKNLRPLKTMSPRAHHAKTPSSSSASSYGSSAFSAMGEPATPVSSNASTSNFETISSNNSKKEIPRNTMSPKHDKYLAKIFVICCHCNYWHDVPSGMYAQMNPQVHGLPDHLVRRVRRRNRQHQNNPYSQNDRLLRQDRRLHPRLRSSVHGASMRWQNHVAPVGLRWFI
ncbi:hypothetical protein TSTA_006140 [Talaromyces stipitatus ATCC 10500]|nr:uncharacterized protein TSTA_006140 [Talaromyces stipitatus ATCC 10500]EED12584.1 hypothetical protein TSTA_006140 [Talaromyces stipitatus ATCC 10500]